MVRLMLDIDFSLSIDIYTRDIHGFKIWEQLLTFNNTVLGLPKILLSFIQGVWFCPWGRYILCDLRCCVIDYDKWVWVNFLYWVYQLQFRQLIFWMQVVYINGRPFVLRDVERPFSNLEYTVNFLLEFSPSHLHINPCSLSLYFCLNLAF